MERFRAELPVFIEVASMVSRLRGLTSHLGPAEKVAILHDLRRRTPVELYVGSKAKASAHLTEFVPCPW